MRAYICRRFIPTTAFLVALINVCWPENGVTSVNLEKFLRRNNIKHTQKALGLLCNSVYNMLDMMTAVDDLNPRQMGRQDRPTWWPGRHVSRHLQHATNTTINQLINQSVKTLYIALCVVAGESAACDIRPLDYNEHPQMHPVARSLCFHLQSDETKWWIDSTIKSLCWHCCWYRLVGLFTCIWVTGKSLKPDTKPAFCHFCTNNQNTN